MIYKYDEAIVEDLQKSFNSNNTDSPLVRVTDPETSLGLAAQLANDELNFPIIALMRSEDMQIDSSRSNFTRLHTGVACVFDKETNEYYNEKAIPVTLEYSLTVLATNSIDMDEIIRELLFKYTQMYFLSIRLPYESNRRIRFGISIPTSSPIEYSSRTPEYLSSGKLYQAIVPLHVEGAVLVHYTPIKLRRMDYEVVAAPPESSDVFDTKNLV